MPFEQDFQLFSIFAHETEVLHTRSLPHGKGTFNAPSLFMS